MKKRIGILLLSLALCLNLLPTAAWATEPTHTNHCICGKATHANVGNHNAADVETWTAWDSAANSNYTTTLPAEAGYYYLTANVTISATWEPVNGTFLCLNGHSIICNAGSHDHSSNNVATITVKSGRTFTLTDCNTDNPGKITHTIVTDTSGYGSGVAVEGTFNMYGGSISENEGDYNRGGVYMTAGTFNLYGGTITQNKTQYGGGVYTEGGSFTMYGGSISGNTGTDYGGGIYMQATFNMRGGNITGNTAGSYGSGVYVVSGKTFNMYSGSSITGNTADKRGGGVYISSSTSGSNPGTFNMSGGTVANNSATFWGGGVCTNGKFIMSGGSITGNNITQGDSNASAQDTPNGGGVYVHTHGSFTASGNVQVKDNVKGGTQQAGGNYTGGSANNVSLDSKTITISSALTSGASIGVTPLSAPSGSGSSVVIAKAGTDYDLTKSDKNAFFPDAGTTGYHIALDTTNDQLKLCAGAAPAHSHTWSYSANGTTITATCSNTDDNCSNTSGGSITIVAPTELTYNGADKVTTLTAINWQGPTVDASNITYKIKNGDNWNDLPDGTTLPKNVGTYTASITLGTTTASVTYTITAKSITATVGAISDQAFTGSQITPNVTVKDGDTILTQNKDYTLSYGDNNTVGTNAGSVIITAKSGGNYTFDSVTKNFNITKATAPTLNDINVYQKFSINSQQSKNIGRGEMPENAGALTYAKGTETKPDSVNVDWNVDSAGIVTYTITNGAINDVITLPVIISSTNYADSTVNVKITLTARDAQNDLTLTSSAETVVYNGTLTLSTTGGSGTGDVTYAIVTDGTTGNATFIDNTLTATKAGTVKIKATKAADTNYEAKDSNIITISINKADPTGVPKYTAITTSGKTLSDAALVKPVVNQESGGFSVPGTVKWVDDAGDELPDTTEVLANTTYKWLFTPNDSDNYNTLAGTITLYSVSTSGSGSSYIPTYTITVENSANGSITVSPKNASKGDTVTITVDPDKGYNLETLTVLDKNGNEINLIDNGNGKYTFKMPASKITVKVIFTKDNSLQNFFTDVPTDAYYYDAVLWVAQNHITEGVTETTFGPDLSCSRGQLVTFLWRMAGSPSVDFSMNFVDVDQNAYYNEAIRWAASLGIVGGYGNGLFGTDNTITREQMAVILYRFAQTIDMDTTQGGTAVWEFADYESISDYAIEAMQWAVNAGILQGYNNNLMPAEPCTRAQIATMLYRMCH